MLMIGWFNADDWMVLWLSYGGYLMFDGSYGGWVYGGLMLVVEWFRDA